ncbi:hypothetical protein Tco_0393029 [Tanacetum coccineum]
MEDISRTSLLRRKEENSSQKKASSSYQLLTKRDQQQPLMRFFIIKDNPLVKDEDGVEEDVHEYRSVIGSLMYLTTSRPDIVFAVYACDKHGFGGWIDVGDRLKNFGERDATRTKTTYGKAESSHLVKKVKILEKGIKRKTQKVESMRKNKKSTNFVILQKLQGGHQEEDISPYNLGEEINTERVEINTGIEEVSTGSAKVYLIRGRLGLEEAIKLQAQMDEEVAKQIHLDKLIAKRMAAEEALSEQQKKRKAQLQFEA